MVTFGVSHLVTTTAVFPLLCLLLLYSIIIIIVVDVVKIVINITFTCID